jgi:hypothetical protein
MQMVHAAPLPAPPHMRIGWVFGSRRESSAAFASARLRAASPAGAPLTGVSAMQEASRDDGHPYNDNAIRSDCACATIDAWRAQPGMS